MICWTIQHKKVIDILNEQGKYFPDFEMSPQTHRDTYDRLLGIFNELNGTEYKGLIFCIAKDVRTKESVTFRDEVELFEYMKARPYTLQALNNGAYTLLDGDHLLCRIETDKFDKLCLCSIDFWNFIMMMSEDGTGRSRSGYESCRLRDPDLVDISYEEFVEQAWMMMRARKMFRPLMSSTILQYTIPYLEKGMLKGVYSLADIADVCAI